MLVLFPGGRSCWAENAVPLDSRVYFDQTATRVVMVVAILSTDHLLSARGMMVKQLGLDRVHVVQKPLALSFQVPVSLVPENSTGSRVTLPSGVKVILNLVPDGEVAVNDSPLKKVPWISRGAMASPAGATPVPNMTLVPTMPTAKPNSSPGRTKGLHRLRSTCSDPPQRSGLQDGAVTQRTQFDS